MDLFSGKIEGGNHDRIEKEKDGLVGLDDEELLMEKYESEGDEERGKSERKGNGFSISSSSEEEDELNCEGEESLKVYFCSRTYKRMKRKKTMQNKLYHVSMYDERLVRLKLNFLELKNFL